MKGKYDGKYRNLAERYNQELPDLESKHAKELSVFQGQLSSYKKTVEALKQELLNRSETQQSIAIEVSNLKEKLFQSQKDKELLSEQISLHKVQLEELTSKYVAAASILDSKESIERSLEEALTNVAMLKQENDLLKFKYDDLSARYSAAQSLIENNQAHERTMGHRIFDLEKSLSRLSSVSGISEFNETTYQTFDDVAIQFHMTQKKLEEKAQLESQLIDRIRGLEEEVTRANELLTQANLEKESYEKQLKDMKNMCDKMKSSVNSRQNANSGATELFQGSMYFPSDNTGRSPNKESPTNDVIANTDANENEIERLKEIIAQKEKENEEFANKVRDITEKFRESEAECEQLKIGLTTAWEQCAEIEEKLNQTLAMNESRYVDSLAVSRQNAEESTNSFKSTFDQTPEQPKDNSNASLDVKSMMLEIESLRNEKESLLEEVRHLSETVKNFGEISKKLDGYRAQSEKLETENNDLRIELTMQRDVLDSLKKTVDELTKEKASLVHELSNLRDKHREELSAVRSDSMAEVDKLRNMMLSVREGDVGLDQLKAELDGRHAKEMEELRRYFEEKCLQMEKQYSEEIFSQQSKKMSDNDSENDDLGEESYFGGGGDFSNASRPSGENSRGENDSGDVNKKNAESRVVPVVDQVRYLVYEKEILSYV